jgi:hypothetical protein
MTVLTEYQTFIQTVVGALGATHIDKNVAQKVVPGTKPGKTAVRVKKEDPILLRNLPAKPPNSSDKVTVGLSFMAEYADIAGVPTLQVSNVVVCYWRQVRYATTKGPRERKRFIGSFRFDWHNFAHTQGGAHHPIFHMQVSEPLAQTTPGLRTAPKDILTTMRIPTPPMDVPAALEMVLADHLPMVLESKLMTQWGTQKAKLPRIPAMTCQRHGVTLNAPGCTYNCLSNFTQWP